MEGTRNSKIRLYGGIYVFVTLFTAYLLLRRIDDAFFDFVNQGVFGATIAFLMLVFGISYVVLWDDLKKVRYKNNFTTIQLVFVAIVTLEILNILMR